MKKEDDRQVPSEMVLILNFDNWAGFQDWLVGWSVGSALSASLSTIGALQQSPTAVYYKSCCGVGSHVS